MSKQRDKLYGVMFTYNPHKNMWTAFHREDFVPYWNKGKMAYTTVEGGSLNRVRFDVSIHGLKRKAKE